VEPNGKRSEDCRAVVRRAAVERFIDMLEARRHRDTVPGQERELGRAMGQAFERGEAMRRSELADRVHPCVEIEWREAGTGVADFGNAQTDLRSDVREWVGRH
jgi:hypothetical protein